MSTQQKLPLRQSRPLPDHLRILAELVDSYEVQGRRAFAGTLRKGGPRRNGWVERSRRLVAVDPANVAGAKLALDDSIRAIHSDRFAAAVDPCPPPVDYLRWRWDAPDTEGTWSVRSTGGNTVGDYEFGSAFGLIRCKSLTCFDVPVGEGTWPDGWTCRPVRPF